MRTLGIAVALGLPVVIAACARTPEPPPAPVMTPAELACAGLAAQAAGDEVAAVTVTPVSSTKTGATVYAASIGGVNYTCVVEIDNTVSSFTPDA